MRLLLLGGTSEGRELAAKLMTDGVDVTSSLAGRVDRPRLPAGKVRIGGFGGVLGLRNALVDFDAVVDATHPYAVGMSANAVAACEMDPPVPLLRLERPGWEGEPDWHWVDTHEVAALRAASLGDRPFITVGRQEVASFVPRLGRRPVLARVAQLPDLAVPPQWRIVTSRGPYHLLDELALMREHRADVLVTKDSGGSYAWPTIEASGQLGIPVVVVRRPPAPTGVPVVNGVDEAVEWVRALRAA